MHMNREFKRGDIVQNFKKEVSADSGLEYTYRVLNIATHSETGEKVVVYEALYPPYGTWVRPYDMFISEVDQEKYPTATQKYRFEKVSESFFRKTFYTMKDSFDFEDLKGIVAVLRGDRGCSWDKKQTFETMKKGMIEESQEVITAIDNKDIDNLCEELGDVLLQVVMNSQIAKESKQFTIENVIDGVSQKLVRRHPHVFGDEAGEVSPEKAKEKWQEMKRKEKEGR